LQNACATMSAVMRPVRLVDFAKPAPSRPILNLWDRSLQRLPFGKRSVDHRRGCICDKRLYRLCWRVNPGDKLHQHRLLPPTFIAKPGPFDSIRIYVQLYKRPRMMYPMSRPTGELLPRMTHLLCLETTAPVAV
jgi:hypothetical protein